MSGIGAPWLVKLHKENTDYVVVIVELDRPGANEIDWESPVAQEFDIHERPQFKIADDQGKITAEHEDAEKAVYALIHNGP
jgi:hypothetical protein